MKNIKIKKCKNCKGTGMVQIAEGKKGLVVCPVCKGAGTIETPEGVEEIKWQRKNLKNS